jgi:catechol 2,3-dioxygenase-like lactoylglutathione lyase family enzyme
MVVTGIPMVLVYVTDVSESAKWYAATLDLPVLYQGDRFASLGAGDQRLGLHAGGSGEVKAGSIPVFRVDDYPAGKATLESRGCEFYFENETPNAVFGSFRDPDGNALQIMQDR